MTFQIIRDEEYYKNHLIYTDDVIKYGLEKACILGNIEKGMQMPYEEIYKLFPYLEKEKFYKFLEELIECGALHWIQKRD